MCWSESASPAAPCNTAPAIAPGSPFPFLLEEFTGFFSFVMETKPCPLHPFSFRGISCSGAFLRGQWEADTRHGKFQGECFRFLDNLLLQLSAEVLLINIPASS